MSDQNYQELIRIKKEYAQRDERRMAEIYSDRNPAFLFYMQEREKEILTLLKQEKIDLAQSSILDVGCGTGHVLQRFIDFGAKEGTGIDLMESRLGVGRDQYPRLRLFEADAARLPFKENEFDLVMQFMCFSSVLDTAMRQKMADEMWRVVKPGGAILFYDLRPVSKFLPLFIRVSHYLERVVRAFRKKEMLASYVAAKLSPSTSTRSLPLSEIKELFREGSFHCRSVSLDFRLAKLASKTYFIATVLSCLPFLRTHYLALIRKPA